MATLIVALSAVRATRYVDLPMKGNGGLVSNCCTDLTLFARRGGRTPDHRTP